MARERRYDGVSSNNKNKNNNNNNQSNNSRREMHPLPARTGNAPYELAVGSVTTECMSRGARFNGTLPQ